MFDFTCFHLLWQPSWVLLVHSTHHSQVGLRTLMYEHTIVCSGWQKHVCGPLLCLRLKAPK